MVKDFFYRLLRPRHWLRNYKTCKEWDSFLNELLDSNLVEKERNCSVKIGEVGVWISNYPYAYGSPYSPYELDILPKPRTVDRLRKREVEDMIRKMQEESNGTG